MVYTADLKSAAQGIEGSSPSTRTKLVASADGAVPGLLNQVMGVRISPEAPVMPLWTNLVKSALSKGVPWVSRFESEQGYQIL